DSGILSVEATEETVNASVIKSSVVSGYTRRGSHGQNITLTVEEYEQLSNREKKNYTAVSEEVDAEKVEEKPYYQVKDTEGNVLCEVDPTVKTQIETQNYTKVQNMYVV
ncbi:MAG: hypothetical protein IJ409_06840, partial [Lachnospiraceae bacterium]|nr:hypothetical protein [Lachnospiraceae bacterium]